MLSGSIINQIDKTSIGKFMILVPEFLLQT